MYVEYFFCLIITYNIHPCSFTLFLLFKLDMHAHLLFLFRTWLTIYCSTLLFLFTLTFALLFLFILVPTCFLFHKPQPDICFFLTANTPGSSFTCCILLCSVRWNLHLLEGFKNSGTFILFFNCLLSPPYHSDHCFTNIDSSWFTCLIVSSVWVALASNSHTHFTKDGA